MAIVALWQIQRSYLSSRLESHHGRGSSLRGDPLHSLLYLEMLRTLLTSDQLIRLSEPRLQYGQHDPAILLLCSRKHFR